MEYAIWVADDHHQIAAAKSGDSTVPRPVIFSPYLIDAIFTLVAHKLAHVFILSIYL